MGEESDPIPILLARIEVKLDQALNASADHEDRIRSLERWRYALPVTGLVAFGSAITSAITVMSK